MISNCEEILTYIKEKIRDAMDIAVVGLSGGADSTLTAILCREALGKENVYGISMPYNNTDEKTFNMLSSKLAQKISIHHIYRNISAIADAIDESVSLGEISTLSPLNRGNSRSRARMCVLYGFSSTLSGKYPGKRVRVVGTGNLSEDYIGYDTKGGDALADFFPIGDLFKSEVYQLLEYFRDKKVIDEENINRVPSAGLENEQTDEKDLGYSYNEMEKAVRYLRKLELRETPVSQVVEFVKKRHREHYHKHEAPPAIALRSLPFIK